LDIDEVAKSLRSFESTWLLLSRWQTERDEISDEEQPTYRTHIYNLNDFLDHWDTDTSHAPSSDVSMYLLERVRALISYYPDVTLVRKENWQAEHLEQPGIILKYEKPMKINELKLRDMITLAEAIHVNTHRIRALGEYAKSEGTIHNTLHEVRE
jgi:hypothetical protein